MRCLRLFSTFQCHGVWLWRAVFDSFCCVIRPFPQWGLTLIFLNLLCGVRKQCFLQATSMRTTSIFTANAFGCHECNVSRKQPFEQPKPPSPRPSFTASGFGCGESDDMLGIASFLARHHHVRRSLSCDSCKGGLFVACLLQKSHLSIASRRAAPARGLCCLMGRGLGLAGGRYSLWIRRIPHASDLGSGCNTRRTGGPLHHPAF